MKNWCFTLFSKDGSTFNEHARAYLIFGRETFPDTCRLYFQGFILFKNSARQCKKMVPVAYFQRVRGSIQENLDYCNKDDQFKAFGTCPSLTYEFNSYTHYNALAEKGEFSTIKMEYPALYIHYRRTLESFRVH